MAKKWKVPRKLFGFKLSKGTRKDLKKLLKMLGRPDTHRIATSALGALIALLTERMAAHQLPAETEAAPAKQSPTRAH